MKPAPTRSEKREGAAMLVTMLVLLVATGTALFSVHATTFEMRSAGATRAQAQTQYVGEAGLNAVIGSINQQDAASGVGAASSFITSALCAAYAPASASANNAWLARTGEPPLAPGKSSFSVVMQSLEVQQGAYAIENRAGRDRSTGSLSVYTPVFVVDSSEVHDYPFPVAGMRADAPGDLKMFAVVMTSRGRMEVPGDYRNASAGDTWGLHTVASDARAIAILGPTRAPQASQCQ